MLERMIRARGHVDALRSALVSPSPEDLERCLPTLEEAVVCLREVEAQLQRLGAQEMDVEISQEQLEQLRREANDLQESLQIARRVLQQGATFVGGWMNVLGMTAASYTATGAPPEAAPAAKISVEG
ncbi:MAG: hypothetical protein ABL967_11425 [Bryobacteraceae bacterium]